MVTDIKPPEREDSRMAGVWGSREGAIVADDAWPAIPKMKSV
jgi:hypothetical protein